MSRPASSVALRGPWLGPLGGWSQAHSAPAANADRAKSMGARWFMTPCIARGRGRVTAVDCRGVGGPAQQARGPETCGLGQMTAVARVGW